MPEAPPVHIAFDRRKVPRAERLRCVGGPLNGDRLVIWPVESAVRLRSGRYERTPISDSILTNALDLSDDTEVLVWHDSDGGCEW